MSVILAKGADGTLRVVGPSALGYVNIRMSADGQTYLSGTVDLSRATVKVERPPALPEQVREKVETQKKKEAGWLGAFKRLGHAGVAIASNAAGVGVAPWEIVQARRSICGACEHCKPCVGGLTRCCGTMSDVLDSVTETCGCVIVQKTRREGEHCPLGKW